MIFSTWRSNEMSYGLNGCGCVLTEGVRRNEEILERLFGQCFNLIWSNAPQPAVKGDAQLSRGNLDTAFLGSHVLVLDRASVPGSVLIL